MIAPAADRFTRWRWQWRRLRDRVEWRLTEHFFGALFDFGILSTAGGDSLRHMLLGAIGGFVAGGLLLTYLYLGKYAALARAAPDLYRRAVLGDDLQLVGLPMLVVAFVTLLISHSLFPDERDLRILGSLPVRKAVVFGAKLTALLLFTGLVILVVHVSLIPLVLLTSLRPIDGHGMLARLILWTMTSVAGSMFAMLAVTAIVGLFTLALARSRFHELTGITRSAILLVLVLCVPLVLRLPNVGAAFANGATWLQFVPPAWFVGLQQVLGGSHDPWFLHLATIAIAAVSTATVIVAIAYAVLFRHVERLMLGSIATTRTSPPTSPSKPPPISPPWSLSPSNAIHATRTRAFARATPAFRAVHRFTLLTFRRSQLHQSVLIGLSACGVGLAMNRLIDANLAGWLVGAPPPAALTSAALWTPFALMLVCGLGIRSALALPMGHRANWIFRMTEDDATRRDQLRAVDQVVTMYVVGVPVAFALPLLWIAMGSTALIAAAIVALTGAVFAHAVLLDWRRIPFTCSYLPGKRFVARSLLSGSLSFTFFTLAGTGLVHTATSGPVPALIIATTLAIAAWLLRRRRFALWQQTPLMFDDQFPDELLQLHLWQ